MFLFELHSSVTKSLSIKNILCIVQANSDHFFTLVYTQAFILHSLWVRAKICIAFVYRDVQMPII